MNLEDRHWTAADGVQRYPARGEMNHRHIRNCLRLLEARARSVDQLARIQEGDMYRALRMGLTLPDPGDYQEQDPNWRLGAVWEDYTLEEHIACTDWAQSSTRNAL